jgi:hypothetical protein
VGVILGDRQCFIGNNPDSEDRVNTLEEPFLRSIGPEQGEFCVNAKGYWTYHEPTTSKKNFSRRL